MMFRISLILFVILSLPIPVQSQELEKAQEKELKEWVAAAKSWQKWASVWYNDAMHRNRRVKIISMPDPPTWLAEHCSMRQKDDVTNELYAESCRLLTELEKFRNGNAVTWQTEFTRAREETDKGRSKFWERLHVDAMWIPTAYGSNMQKAYGWFGGHFTLMGIGRIQLYGPPGIMLMKLEDGSHKIGYTWGLSIELFEFKLPGSRQLMLAHFNITKAWIMGQRDSATAARSGLDMGGLSFTFKNN